MTAGAYAQGSVRFGVKAGANLNKLDGKGYKDGFNFNYHLGPYVQLNFSDRFGIQPELIFSQSTAKSGEQFSDIYPDGKDLKNIKLNYLSIPILANIGLGGEHFKLQVGPQYGIAVSKDKTLFENGKDAFKSGDFSAVAGLWLDLPFGLNVSGRYIIGLSNISDLPEEEKWHNQAIQLGVGYTF
ncbi:porin family protein [Compostibacter hankyongensis]|uniref:Porin family protein n=2 Tax=Compostibacter hankyongensis TaxID=1007089 RepID=A0ABP8FWS3_9BACT